MVMSGLCSVVAAVAIIVFGSTTMIRNIFWGSIIDQVVVTNHDVTTAQLVAGVWLVLKCIHWLAVSKWLPKVDRRTLLFASLSKLFPSSVRPVLALPACCGDELSEFAKETVWSLVMCSLPHLLQVFSTSTQLCSVICDISFWAVSTVMASSAMYALMLPHSGRARAVRGLVLAAFMSMGAPIDTTCGTVDAPSLHPVPEAPAASAVVRGTTTVDAGWCDIDDEPPLNLSGLPSTATAQYTALNQPTFVAKSFPDNQANCTVVNDPSYLIDPKPLRMTASTASASPAIATHYGRIRLGIRDDKGRTAAATTTAVCIPTQTKLLVGTNTMEQNVHFIQYTTWCHAILHWRRVRTDAFRWPILPGHAHQPTMARCATH